MNINEPPMALDEMKESTVFNKDVYRFYQSGGRTVDYYVWPALRLYKGGPLLSKGVAEGK